MVILFKEETVRNNFKVYQFLWEKLSRWKASFYNDLQPVKDSSVTQDTGLCRKRQLLGYEGEINVKSMLVDVRILVIRMHLFMRRSCSNWNYISCVEILL